MYYTSASGTPDLLVPSHMSVDTTYGTCVCIGSGVAESDSSIDFSLSDEYNCYMFVVNKLHPSGDGINIGIRFSYSGVYKTANYSYSALQHTTGATVGYGTNATYMAASYLAMNVGSATGEGFSGIFWVYNPSMTSTKPHITGLSSWENSSGTILGSNMMGWHDTVDAIDGIRIICSTGNIHTGKFLLYGLK